MSLPLFTVTDKLLAILQREGEPLKRNLQVHSLSWMSVPHCLPVSCSQGPLLTFTNSPLAFITHFRLYWVISVTIQTCFSNLKKNFDPHSPSAAVPLYSKTLRMVSTHCFLLFSSFPPNLFHLGFCPSFCRSYSGPSPQWPPHHQVQQPPLSASPHLMSSSSTGHC